MILASIIILLGVAVLLLNYSGTKIVLSSAIHTDNRKQMLIGLIWVIPILGVIITMLLINRDIKKNHRKLDEEIAPVIRELGNKIKHLEKDLQQDLKQEFGQEKPPSKETDLKKWLH